MAAIDIDRAARQIDRSVGGEQQWGTIGVRKPTDAPLRKRLNHRFAASVSKISGFLSVSKYAITSAISHLGSSSAIKGLHVSRDDPIAS